MVKEDAVVIDVGFNEVHDSETGKWHVIGDVDFSGSILQFLKQLLHTCVIAQQPTDSD